MNSQRRLLGLDYGDKTVGVAVCDPSRLFCTPIETIRRPREIEIKKTIARLGEIIKEYDIGTIVLGYPKNMDGTEGFRCQKTNEFKARLGRNFKRVEIILWDERLSTVEALRYLQARPKRQRENLVDQAAASVILQSYLDYLRGGVQNLLIMED